MLDTIHSLTSPPPVTRHRLVVLYHTCMYGNTGNNCIMSSLDVCLFDVVNINGRYKIFFGIVSTSHLQCRFSRVWEVRLMSDFSQPARLDVITNDIDDIHHRG